MYIRTLKMYTWEDLFAQRVLQIRQQEFQFLSVSGSSCHNMNLFRIQPLLCCGTYLAFELNLTLRFLGHMQKCKYLDAFCVYFWACTPTIFSLFTFGLYAILGHSLDAATVSTLFPPYLDCSTLLSLYLRSRMVSTTEAILTLPCVGNFFRSSQALLSSTSFCRL